MFYYEYFSDKLKFGNSCLSFAKIHMKCQSLFSLNNTKPCLADYNGAASKVSLTLKRYDD